MINLLKSALFFNAILLLGIIYIVFSDIEYDFDLNFIIFITFIYSVGITIYSVKEIIDYNKYREND